MMRYYTVTEIAGTLRSARNNLNETVNSYLDEGYEIAGPAELDFVPRPARDSSPRTSDYKFVLIQTLVRYDSEIERLSRQFRKEMDEHGVSFEELMEGLEETKQKVFRERHQETNP